MPCLTDEAHKRIALTRRHLGDSKSAEAFHQEAMRLSSASFAITTDARDSDGHEITV